MIPMNDFKREYKFLQKRVDKAIAGCLASGWYVLGQEVVEFEKDFAKYIGTKYCVGVANGLEALQVSLMVFGIGRGDEVLTVANSAVATALAISNVGAKPVFVDIGDDYLIDTKDLEKKITKKTKAIIPVHLFGQTADMAKIRKIAKKHQLKIIEDACQAHGAMQKRKMAGNLGSIACFSFYPTKNLGAYGDGGAITTNSEETYQKCLMLRNYGQKNRYVHEVLGINSRLDELQAAVLRVKLSRLDFFVNKRNKIAKLYSANLRNVPQIALPKINKGNYHAFHLFVVRAKKRDELMSFLKEHGINVLIHYPIPIHKQKCYRQFNRVKLPKTEQFADEILSLPVHPFLTKKEVLFICKLINNFYD